MKFDKVVKLLGPDGDSKLWRIHTYHDPKHFGSCYTDTANIEISSHTRSPAVAFWTLVHEIGHTTFGSYISEEGILALENNLKVGTGSIFDMKLTLKKD